MVRPWTDLFFSSSRLGILSPRRWLHRALLRGLRAPRVPHPLPLEQRSGGDLRVSSHRIPTANGRQLASWMVLPDPPSMSPPAVVQVMHGWGANASMMWDVVPQLLHAGFAAQLLDARCHGDSDEEPFTSLPRFAQDMQAGLHWLQAFEQVDGRRTALLGHSVGAAAALLLASGADQELPVPTYPPRAVVSLSVFAHPAEVMHRFLEDRSIPRRILGDAILAHVQQVIGARFDDIAPLSTLPRLRMPVLLVHGRQDRTVPMRDAIRLQCAAPCSRLLHVDGDHDLRKALAPHASTVCAFLAASLGTRDEMGAELGGRNSNHLAK